jgi:hypothetical protein
MMATTETCPTCGVVVPGRLGRCPACGVRSGRRPIVIGIALVSLAAVLGIGAFAWTRYFGRNPAPRPIIVVTPGVSRLSPDARGTDVAATLDNPNPMPVDVTIRVRGLDITNRVVVEKTLGPYRGLRPGTRRDIGTHLSATPLETVTFEPIDVAPTDLDRP